MKKKKYRFDQTITQSFWKLAPKKNVSSNGLAQLPKLEHRRMRTFAQVLSAALWRLKLKNPSIHEFVVLEGLKIQFLMFIFADLISRRMKNKFRVSNVETRALIKSQPLLLSKSCEFFETNFHPMTYQTSVLEGINEFFLRKRAF